MATAISEQSTHAFLRERQTIYGVGMIIVDPSGQNMLVATEAHAKAASDREVGQISPPLETVKSRRFWGSESLRTTAIAAMTEVADDTTLPYLRRHLRLARPHGPTTIRLTPEINAHIAIGVYDGDMTQDIWRPTNGETHSPRWIGIDEFLQRNDARPLARVLVQFARDQGYLTPTTLAQREALSPVWWVRSLRRFHDRRETRGKDLIKQDADSAQ